MPISFSFGFSLGDTLRRSPPGPPGPGNNVTTTSLNQVTTTSGHNVTTTG